MRTSHGCHSDLWLHIFAAERAAAHCQFLHDEYQRSHTDEALTALQQQCVISMRMSAAALSAWASASDDNDVEEMLREFLVPHRLH